MLTVPSATINQYHAILESREIATLHFADYKKWLRYFLDFCAKYPVTDPKSDHVRMFLDKLREKKQTETQCRQAAHAVSLYFEMLEQTGSTGLPKVSWQPTESSRGESPVVREPGVRWRAPENPAAAPASTQYGSFRVQYCEAGYQEKSDSPEWDEVLAKLAAEIKVRHYSRKTLKTYAKWSRCFQRFLNNKPPQELTTADVKEYLTFLAVKCHVAASTQNQAFNIG